MASLIGGSWESPTEVADRTYSSGKELKPEMRVTVNKWMKVGSVVGTAIVVAVVILVSQEAFRGSGPNRAAPVGRQHLQVHAKPQSQEVANIFVPKGGVDQAVAVDEAQQIANEHRELPESARGDLLSFIFAGKPEGLRDSEWQERVNVILNSLRDQQGGADSSQEGLTRLLEEMAASDPDPILQMYAMQHLSLWYPRIEDAEERMQVLDLLTQILGQKGERSRGSALQALSDIARNGAAQEVQQAMEVMAAGTLMEQAAAILGDRDEKVDVRICALQACVADGQKEVLISLRDIATNTEENTVLRKSALNGIGRLGTLGDLALLEIVRSEDVRCSVASEAAIKRLKIRHPAARLSRGDAGGNTF